MASTQQFAFEYVQNGRAPLEGHLQKPSLVVDELRKHNILSEKQVREIKSHKKRSVKTRKMLDMVMKKGEYASYELLKILYNTRNQTFPRTNPTQNQPRHPDLHQWISCFSFTDDPDLQNDLVSGTQLRSKAVEFLHAKWDQHMHFLKDKAKCKPFSYIPVVLDTDSSELSKTKSKYKKARSKKLKTYIPRDKGKLSPGHLLESNEKKILLVGKPGIGKTTVVQQVLSLWAENENHQESYMFYFDEPSMRSMSHSSQPSSLRSLLFERYLKPEEGTEDVVLCDIQNNSENVIFVFDGIMDVIGNPVLNNILAKELLCDAKILTTCRPEAEDCEFLSDWPSYRVEVQGFNNESIHAYLKWMLGTEDDYVCSVASNDALFSLCHVPMYAFIVTACISFSPSEANNHPCTITEMYVRIFRHCMKRHGDQNVEYLDKYIHDNMGNIKFIATNSFQALLAKTVNLTGMDCKDNRVQRAFLTSSAAKELSTGHSFAFLHNTMQEFWAALFLLMTPGNITAVLQQCQTEEGKYLKYIVSFLCGLLSSDIAELINCVVPEDQIREISDIYLEKVIDTFLSPATLQGHDESHTELDADLLFVCQCLYERQSPEACSLLLQKVEYELDLNGQYLDPQQCCAVSYVINQSKNRNVCLYLNDCTFSDPGLRLILGSLKNLQCLRLDPTTQCQLWKAALHSGNPSDSEGLLRLCEYEIHLRVKEQRDQKVWERVGEVLKRKRPEKVKLCLHLVDNSLHAADSLGKSIFDCLPSIEAIRFVEPVDLRQSFVAWKMEVSSFQQDILLHGALYQMETGLKSALDYTITLSGWLPTVTCNAVGAVLGQSAPGEKLNVSLTPDSISFQGAAVLFKQVKEFHKLKVNEMSTAKLARLAKSTSCRSPMVVEELTLVLSRPIPKEGVQCRVLSGLASLLRVWTVRILNLRDCPIHGFLLTTLLLSKETLQQLAVVVYEAQDEELTQCFLEKLGSDLSNCTLDWDVLHYLLKSTTQPITINLRRSRIRDQYIPHLLPLLKNVHFQRTGTSSQFERTALREIHEQRAGHLVNSLVRSSDEWINLNNLVLNHDDCEALRFALHYSDGVKLNLLLTIIPKEEMESILTLLHRVSELRVDRNLLLELLHTCAGLRTKRGAAPALLTVLHHKLDLSCSSAMDLFGQEKENVLSLSFGDCRVISAAIQEADGDTELILHDCHVDDAGLEELLHVFHRIHMSFGKPLLLHLLHLRFVEDGDRSVRLASLLSRTLEKKMDLSQSPLDLRACSTLALLLEHSEGLSELDLSDCHLTDTHLDVLLPHLHKVQVLNLCNNEITDKGAVKLNLYMIGNSFTETVWLSNNMITEFDILMEDNRYKLCPAHMEPGWHDQRISSLGSTSGTNETSKTKTLIEEFDPDKTITDKKITYRVQCGSRGRFQCRATGLVFGMRGPGIVEYSVVHWDRGILANTSYEPAGPLFQLRSPEGHMYQLHLPHCEVNVSAAENLLVAHICRNNREFLIPKVTHSHVIVSISGLSHYGKARKKQSNSNRIQGQVLLFLEPEATPEEKRLWVFLLPRDMPPDEVENQHKEFTFIKTSSSCMLTLTAKYSVTSDLKQGFSVQPKKYTLHIAHCPYQHATFEVFLNCGVTELKMNIWETTKLKTRKRWTRRVILNTPRADNAAQVKRFTEQQWIKNLCEILGDLSKDERKRLKSMMRNKEQKPITKSALEGRKSPEELAELMVETWGMHGSIKATREFMERLPRRDDRVTSLLQPFL
ncbi:unnamed protein product [Coregonus sp. 'balchen']|nr:unnamed protein product [Coregonus sp. 'balchen']